MKVLIIEDEQPAYNRLLKLVEKNISNIESITHLDSVQESKKWLEENDTPDLIFLDIHLSDGSAFDLLKEIEIEAPIIFTTAYNEYAVQAFKTSGIGYILKPVKEDELKATLTKVDDFKKIFSAKEQQVLLDAISPADYKKRFLVRFGDTIKTIPVEDIAYFFSESKATFAKTFEERTYPIDNNLDSLEKVLNPEQFFRINRQYLISVNAINDMKAYSKARVLVKLKPEAKEVPVVSSERSAAFKKWLAGELY